MIGLLDAVRMSATQLDFFADPAQDLLDPRLSPTDRNAAGYARDKASLRVGGRYARFQTRIVRVEFHDGPGADYPKWFKGPAKCKGESAMFWGLAGAVFVKTDMQDPDPLLDDETRAAWADYVRPRVAATSPRPARKGTL